MQVAKRVIPRFHTLFADICLMIGPNWTLHM